MVHWVDLEDGRRVQYGCENCLPEDLDHSNGAFGFALVPLADNPFDPTNISGAQDTLYTRTHFRLRTITEILLGIKGNPEHYICMQILYLPLLPDGKKRAAYAKHHSMEACYLFSGDFSYWRTVEPTTAQATVLPEATKQAIVENSKAGMSSPAAAAALAYVGHIQTPEEQAGQVNAGQASRCAVITDPPGAEIDIDGNKAGLSPMVIMLLRKGDSPRVITIKMNGYKTVVKNVVPDGKIISLGLTLEKESQEK